MSIVPTPTAPVASRAPSFASCASALALAAALLAGGALPAVEYDFVRGDINDDGILHPIGDAIYLLAYGFNSGPAPVCDDAADSNDDGFVHAIGDAIYLLSYGFTGGPAPALPFPTCGSDATADLLGCDGPTLCGPTEHAPVITSVPLTGATEGILYQYDVQATDEDGDDALLHELVAGPPGMTIDPDSGLVSLTPSAAQSDQSFPVEVRVVDSTGLSDTQSWTLAVADVNQAPAIVSAPLLAATEGTPYLYDAAATDPDPGDALAWSLAAAPAGATIDPVSGLVAWTPGSAQTGPAAFTVVVTDDGSPPASDAQGFTVTVEDVNFAPTIVSAPPLGGTEGTTYLYDADATDPDPADALAWSLVVAPAGAMIDPASGLLTWTPGATQTGAVPFEIAVSDDGSPAASDTQAFIVTVENVNFAPTIVSAPPLDATEGTPYLYDAAATDPDPEDTLAWSFALAPEGATIDAATGLVEWVPGPAQTGPWDFTILVADDGIPSAGDAQAFTVLVEDVNFAPAIVSMPPLVADAGVLYLYDAEATDVDPSDLLTWSLSVAPAGASIDTESGLVEWAPTTAQAGRREFTVVVSDDGNPTETASQEFTVEVIPPVNIAPTISGCPNRGALVGETVTCALDAGDANPSDALLFSLPVAPPGATIDPQSGFLAWTPGATDPGTHPFTVRVSDDGVPPLFAETSFAVTVVAAGAPLWRINAGGPAHTDSLGRVWSADTGCAFGCTNTSSTLSPIAGAADPTLYRSHRWFAGDFRYSLAVPPGIPTTVRLHFANIFAGTSTPGTRVFDVDIEGAPALVGFDIIAAAGHLTAHIEEFPVPPGDGSLDLDFRLGAANNPLVSGIEVLAGPPANEPPVLHSAPVTQVLVGASYPYAASAYDPNGDPLLYAFAGSAPAGATIDPDTGAIAWVPSAGQAGVAHPITVRATDPSGEFDEQVFAVLVIDPVPGAVLFRVNCGGAAIADAPLAWAANLGTGASSFVNTGNTTTNSTLTFIPDGTVPAGTPLALYSTERWDAPALPEMQWIFPIGLPGSYEVRLFFSENFAGAQAPGVRRFDVLVEGALFLDDFDSFVGAGGVVGGATMRSTVVAVADAALAIDFLHVAGGNNPSVKAIEVRVAP